MRAIGAACAQSSGCRYGAHGNLRSGRAACGAGHYCRCLCAVCRAGACKAVPPFALPRRSRWTTNLALYAVDTLAVRLILPLAMVGAALRAKDAGWGLFNAAGLPAWAESVLAILLLDLALYIQHRATHRIPLLWRLHKVHHVDPGFDVTTAARFPPGRDRAFDGLQDGRGGCSGRSATGGLRIRNGFAVFTLFTHTNFRLPARWRRLWRSVFITPDLHRIHHSVRPRETNSNYGTFLSGWDRLLGTYVGRRTRGQTAMQHRPRQLSG